MDLLTDLHDLLDKLPTDEKARVVILQGAGKGFCAGADLAAILSVSTGDEFLFQKRFSTLMPKIRQAPQPFIEKAACIHGAAAGGGFSLALACDVRIAAKSAKFTASFVKVGLSGSDMGFTYFLTRAVGSSVASELALTGNTMDAKRALATGIVSDVVEDEKLEETGTKMAEAMLQCSHLGLITTKEVLNVASEGDLATVLACEDRQQILCMLNPQAREVGMRHAERFTRSKL